MSEQGNLTWTLPEPCDGFDPKAKQQLYASYPKAGLYVNGQYVGKPSNPFIGEGDDILAICGAIFGDEGFTRWMSDDEYENTGIGQ
jgi:hypothetical protein